MIYLADAKTKRAILLSGNPAILALKEFCTVANELDVMQVACRRSRGLSSQNTVLCIRRDYAQVMNSVYCGKYVFFGLSQISSGGSEILEKPFYRGSKPHFAKKTSFLQLPKRGNTCNRARVLLKLSTLVDWLFAQSGRQFLARIFNLEESQE